MPQGREQVQRGGERSAVFQIKGHGANVVGARGAELGTEAGNVEKTFHFKAVGVHLTDDVVAPLRVAGKARAADIQPESPVAGAAGQRGFESAVQPVARQVMVVALQKRLGAGDDAVAAVEGVDLDVAEVALGVIRIKRVLEAEVRVGPPLGDRAQPLHVLGIQAVGAVVVLTACARVDGQAARGVLPQGRAPVGAIDVLGLVFIGQGVRELGREIGKHRSGNLPGAGVYAVHMRAGAFHVHVQPRVVGRAGGGVARNQAVQPHGAFLERAVAQAQARFADGAALGHLGDVVDRAAHAARAIQEAGCAAYGFHAVIHPAIDRTHGDAVLQVDAVEKLIDGSAGKTAPMHVDAAGCVMRRHARHAAQDVLRVLRAGCLDGAAVDDGDGRRHLARRQPQAAGRGGGGVQREPARIQQGAAVLHLHFGQCQGSGCGFGAGSRRCGVGGSFG